MKTTILLAAIGCLVFISSCSKSSSNGAGGGLVTYDNSKGLVPLAVNSVWNYRLKDYNPTTGAVVDSTDFTLKVIAKTAANDITYFELQNSLNGSVIWLTNIDNATIGSIDSVNGVNYFTAFVSGTGDSTQSVSSWPAYAGGSCIGTAKLFGYYADTTLTDLEGHTFTSAIKNDEVIYNCSDKKYEARVYFVKQGVGIVRFVDYSYAANGTRQLETAWLLQSYTLAN